MANKKNVPVTQARKEGKPMAANENEPTFTKLIVKDDTGAEYTLEFNARVVKNMERRGFKVDLDFPRTCVEELWVGAFQMHHKGIMPERAMKIWDAQTRKDDLLPALVQCYMVPFKELMKEPEGAEDADPTWKTV